MSTQDEIGISFALQPEEQQEHFRLLELPPELLGLLTSSNPPVLSLKSEELRSGKGNASAAAVLCTHDRTYQIRQVGTSNSVYVARPRPADPDGTTLTDPGLIAIAQCTSTLELHPVEASTAATLIRGKIPTYGPLHSTSSDYIVHGKNLRLSKRQLFDDIPLSEAQCEQGWKVLACFESQDLSGCLRPTAMMISTAWKSMSSTATAQGLDLTQFISTAYLDSLLNSSDGWPAGLSRAIVQSMQSNQDDEEGDVDKGVILDRLRCVRLVGVSQLEALCSDSSNNAERKCHKVNFLQTWQDALPEKWRDAVDLDVIKGSYKIEDNGQSIVHVDAVPNANTAISESAAPDTKALLGKRKWHEKFKQPKK